MPEKGGSERTGLRTGERDGNVPVRQTGDVLDISGFGWIFAYFLSGAGELSSLHYFPHVLE